MLSFSLTCIVFTLLVFIPGYISLKAFRLSNLVSLVAAPALSISHAVLAGIVLDRLNIPACGWSMSLSMLIFALIPVLVFQLFSGLLHRWNQRCLDKAAEKAPFSERISAPFASWQQPILQGEWAHLRLDWLILALYLALGLGLVFVLMIFSLPSFDAGIQTYDNTWHYGSIRVFMDSMRMNTMSISLHQDLGSSASNPFPGFVFYPSGWHILCAITAEIAHVSPIEAVNASMFILMGAVWTSGIYLLLGYLIGREKPKVLFAGALFPLALSAFPWALILWLLYSNLAAFCLVPGMIVLFMLLFDEQVTPLHRLGYALGWLIGIFGLIFTQPNAVFTAGVIVLPWFVAKVSRLPFLFKFEGKKLRRARILFAAASVFVISVLWLALPYMSALIRSVTDYTWKPFHDVVGAIFGALGQGYLLPPQFVVATLVLLGLARSVAARRYHWVACSWLFSFVLYVVVTGTELPIRNVLGGFWYTDPYRMAAVSALCSILPLMIGLETVFDFIEHGLHSFVDRIHKEQYIFWDLAAAVLMALMIFSPIPGQARSGFFAYFFDHMHTITRPNDNFSLSARELDFCKRAQALLPKGAVVANVPPDGSAYLYGKLGTPLFWRDRNLYQRETLASHIIRTRLYAFTRDRWAYNAAREAGITHVLILNPYEAIGRGSFSWMYKNVDWRGILDIRDNTPGFRLLLADGAMRLYELVYPELPPH